MDFALRPLREEDIPQVAEIEREAFPTNWPPTPFKREMQNPRIQYLVAWRSSGPAKQAQFSSNGHKSHDGLLRSMLNRLPWSSKAVAEEPASDSFIGGFVGLWFVEDQTHISSIAVWESLRGKGIGELLLMGAVQLGMDRGSREVTLEVRVSNFPAQHLYEKYGLRRVGMRKRYYTDNNEDAWIMTTDPIDTPQYRDLFQRLVWAFRQRHGEPVRVLHSVPGRTSRA